MTVESTPRWGEGIVSPTKSPSFSWVRDYSQLTAEEKAKVAERERNPVPFGFARALEEDGN